MMRGVWNGMGAAVWLLAAMVCGAQGAKKTIASKTTASKTAAPKTVVPKTVVPRAAIVPAAGDVAGTHDPSMAKDGKTWYVFATGTASDGGQLPVRCSEDLEQWRLCGHVFDAIPAWVKEKSPGTKELWAPDVTYVHGEYRLYYAYSLFGRNASGIGLAVTKTLDPAGAGYGWVDKGMVVESKPGDDFNAIDPNLVLDAKGGGWLAFGSFWDGIKMRKLDDAGMVTPADRTLYSLARRAIPVGERSGGSAGMPANWQAIEAPYVVRHGEYFYLFTSWDLCCRGIQSTYRTMVGRSRSVTGPYLDKTGRSLLAGGGSEVLVGNARWLGPGGESVLAVTGSAKGAKDGDVMVFHAYDGTTGRSSLQVARVAWVNGWPQVEWGQ